jgi:hypothetical protein
VTTGTTPRGVRRCLPKITSRRIAPPDPAGTTLLGIELRKAVPSN